MNQGTQQLANGDYAGFFSDAAQVLDIAKQAQANLDHKAATGFSVFDYFRARENDLSKVFAGLLDPRGGHGQREAFLQCFLEETSLLKYAGESGESRGYLPADECWNVDVEYVVLGNRRIDIVLHHPQTGRWLGIENKPWAAEQHDQIRDYLAALHKRDGKARICYLSGRGDHATTVDDSDKDQCLTMPYRKHDKLPSVEGWIERCLSACEAEPVRWFLKDLLKYVRYQFSMEGAPAIDYKGDVMTDTMKKFIIERSERDVRAWDTAALVEKAMPEVRRELLTQFIKEVKVELEDQIQNRASGLKGWATSISANEKLMQKNEGQLVLHKECWRLTADQGDGWLAAGAAINAPSDDWKWVNLCVAAPKEYGNELIEELKAKKPLFSVNENYAPVPIYESKGNWNDNEFLKDTVSEESRKEKAKDVAGQMVTLAKDIESIIDKMFLL